MLNSKNVKVCRKASLSFHAVTDITVKRLRSLFVAGKSPHVNDNKNPSADAVKGEDMLKIKEQVQSFSIKQRHYSSGSLLSEC
jgi:hypothetical protein